MKLTDWFKQKMGRLTLLQLAVQELEEAERKKMEAQTAHEYAAAMIGYQCARIKRLRQQIKDLAKEEK